MIIKRKDIKVGDKLISDNEPRFDTIIVAKITRKYIEDTYGDRFLCNELTKPTKELANLINEIGQLRKTEEFLVDKVWAIIHPEDID